MSLRAFTFAALGLSHEEGIRFHVETAAAPVAAPADVKAKNAQAMSAFQAMMGGVQKRGRRR